MAGVLVGNEAVLEACCEEIEACMRALEKGINKERNQ